MTTESVAAGSRALVGLRAVLGLAIGLMLVALVVLTGWAAVSRRLPGGTPSAIYELITLVCLWAVLLGAAFAEITGRSLYGGAGWSPGPRRWANLARGLASPIAGIVVWLVILGEAMDTFAWQQDGERSSVQLELPLAVWTASLICCLLVLILNACRQVWLVARRPEGPEL